MLGVRKVLMLNAKRIKVLRDKAGLSRDKLAVLADCNAETIYRIESGRKRHGNTRTLEGLARALGVAPGDLLTDSVR